MILSILRFAIDADDISITVTDGTVFPQNQLFDIHIDDEILHGSLVTGNVISVNRAQHGTRATTHIAGSPVSLIVMKDKFVYDIAKTLDTVASVGLVGYTGTPADNEYAKFVDVNTIEGRSYSEMFTDLASVPLSIVLGTELAPAITQAAWTEGAGWTINDGAGTATRVAAASTTMVPTSAIVPDVDKNYKVTFVISSWTAGTMTVTLGGVESTPLQGDQTVHLYVSPYTTGNLIFTPDASFAGVITLVSVKEYTGGELTIEGGILYYDSRGHANRLSHVTRHLSEMQTDTLLDKSRSSLSCTGGVLTYTLYAVYGNGTWNFNGVVYPIDVASASIALVGGTDAAPKTNWVYFELVNNVPTLKVSSTTEPTGNIIMVAEFIIGAVSGSAYTIYAYNRARIEVDSFIKRVIQRAENSGTLYESGGLPTVTQGTPWISVAAAAKWYTGIFKHESANVVTGVSFQYIKNNVWATGTALTDLLFYSDGTALGNHEFANIVWGIVPTTTTASGTVPSTVKLFAILQTAPTVHYSTLATVRQDLYEATNYFPPDTQLKEAFLPIARTIVSEDAPTQLQTFDTGIYWKDLRGRVTSGGGAATGTDLSGYVAKSLYDAYSILFATTDDTPAALVVAEQQVVGRITGGTIKGLSIAETNTLLGVPAATDPGGATLLHVMASVNGATAWSVVDIFDTTVASTQAIGDSAVAGTAVIAAHRDHKHAMPSQATMDTASVAAVAAAGVVFATAKSVEFEAVPATHTAAGVTVTMTAGAALVFGDACYVGTDGKMEKALADDAAITIPATHLCIATISENSEGLFLVYGWATDASWSFDVGKSVYLSAATAGLITKTMPTKVTGNQVQVLGTCLVADTIKWEPSLIVMEYA
jgi:hypothetical protein